MTAEKHFTIVDYFTPWLLAGEMMILVTCLAGDQLLEQISSGVTGATWTKALTDNLTHGLVAFFSWLAVRGEVAPQPLVEMLVCMLMAMAVDSDHFIAARSLNLQDATSLRHRPPFHNSSLIVVGTLLLWILSRTLPSPSSSSSSSPSAVLFCHLPAMFGVAWASHHIRDAARRGLWVWPLGSTRPLGYQVYVLLTLMLPPLTRLVLMYGPSAPSTTPLKLKSSGAGIFSV